MSSESHRHTLNLSIPERPRMLAYLQELWNTVSAAGLQSLSCWSACIKEMYNC